MVAPFSKFDGIGWFGFCLNTGKIAFLKSLILKPTERAYILLKAGARDFLNSPPFEKSTCFYIIISGNVEPFQYFNFETDCLKNENIFQKNGSPSFS